MIDDFINHFNNLNGTTTAVVGIFIAVGAYLVQLFLDSRIMTFVALVSFASGTFLTEYVAANLGIHFSTNPDTDLLLTSLIGMTIGVLGVIASVRLYGAAIDNSKTKIRG